VDARVRYADRSPPTHFFPRFDLGLPKEAVRGGVIVTSTVR
jgi:hypothetical protein